MARDFVMPTLGNPGWGTTQNTQTFPSLDGRIQRRGYDVKSYGALGDGSTDDFTAISAAVADAQAAGGVVFFPAGTYITSQTITVYSNVIYQGAGYGATTIKLKNSSNVDLFKTDQFAALDGVGGAASPRRFVIRDLTLDGNGANQTSGYTLSTYGYDFTVENVQITGGKTGGWRGRYITFSGDQSGREARVRGVKIKNNAGIQLDWQGPSDSQFSDLIVFLDSTFTGAAYPVGSKGVYVNTTNAGGAQFNNLHVWGFHEEALHMAATTFVYNGVVEGGKVNVWIDSSKCQYHGRIFGTNGTGPAAGTEVGLRIGTSPSGFQGEYNCTIGVDRWVSGDHPIEYAADTGGHVRASASAGTATAVVFGSRNDRGQLHVMCDDQPLFCQAPIFSGSGVPANSFGVDGSYYVNKTGGANTHFWFKTAGTWAALTAF